MDVATGTLPENRSIEGFARAKKLAAGPRPSTQRRRASRRIRVSGQSGAVVQGDAANSDVLPAAHARFGLRHRNVDNWVKAS